MLQDGQRAQHVHHVRRLPRGACVCELLQHRSGAISTSLHPSLPPLQPVLPETRI